MKSLAGQLLVAMPQMQDPRFARSVVYLCAHSGDAGAMGLVVNKLLGSLTMGELFTQLDIEPSDAVNSRPVHFGGPEKQAEALCSTLLTMRRKPLSALTIIFV